jgi:signal transduction histidine kinase
MKPKTMSRRSKLVDGIDGNVLSITKLLPNQLISWPLFWLSLPVSILVAVILIAPKSSTFAEIMKWIVIAIFSHFCMAPFVIYMKNKPDKKLQIALVFCMGAVRGGVIGLSAPLFGLVDSVPIPVRMANSAIAVFYWMQIGAIFFDVRDSYRKSLKALLRKAIFEPNSGIEGSASSSSFSNPREKIKVLIADLKVEISSKNGSNIEPTFQEQIEAIDELIDNHIKPQSAKKWADSELIWPKFSFKSVLVQSLSTSRIPLLGVIVLTLPFSIFGNVVGYGFLYGLTSVALSTICLILAYVLINLLPENRFSQFRKNISFLFLWIAISTPTSYLYLKRFTVERDATPSQTLQVEITATLLFLLFLISATMLLSFKELQGRSLELFKNMIPKNELDSFITKGLEAKSQAELAQYLHAEVQSQLHACKLLLLRAAESDFKLFSPSVTQMVMKRLELLDLPYTKSPPRVPAIRIAEIVRAWTGLATIKLDLPTELSVVSPNADVISQLIEEVIVNSIRHGKAKFINISAKIVANVCEVTITNDGLLKAGGAKGLGSTLFDTFADSWTIEEILDGTKIWFAIPFKESSIG